MRNFKLPFKHIHLDFHTSPHIPDVAKDFDAEEFTRMLHKAKVESINLFARDHHGLIYYNSKIHPERIHPHLANRNLLREQVEACHRYGIRAPIYTSIQIDDYSATKRRDWLCIDETGREYETPPLKAGFWRFLDLFHPEYRVFLKEHVREILQELPVDGFWFDIVQARPSLARHWLDAMDDRGYDPESEESRYAFAHVVIDEWMREMTEFILEINPGCSIFYNAGHMGPKQRSSAAAFTHFEVESLPSGEWGYLHLPLSMRYIRTLGKDYLGMTAKFHTTWGDFHSYKNEAALRFEVFHSLALGGKCAIGDQLHPGGRLEATTYDLIEKVFRDVDQKIPWCVDVEPLVDLGVITPEAFEGPLPQRSKNMKAPPAACGAVRMLQELHHQFDMIDAEQDFRPYKVLILPDEVPITDKLQAKLEQHLQAGGSLLASYYSGLNPQRTEFATHLLGVTCDGPARDHTSFLVPLHDLKEELPAHAYVMYMQGLAVTPRANAKVLAKTEVPYFNRSWRHFCSHLHTPNSGRESPHPAAVRTGNAIYFSHPLFTQYYQNAPRWCKTLVGNALRLLLPQPLLRVEGPSSMVATINTQPTKNRDVIHLLHYIPEHRGVDFDVVENEIPLHNVRVSFLTAKIPTAVRLVPEERLLTFERSSDYLSFTVPWVRGHQMVEVTYKGS